MATTKLTTYIRESIIGHMLAHRFKGAYMDMVKGYGQLALDCYNRVYDEPTRRKINKLPEGWLGSRDDVAVQFGTHGSTYRAIDFDGQPDGVDNAFRLRPANFRSPWGENIRKRVLRKHENNLMLSLSKDDPLSQRYFELCKAGNIVTAQYAEARLKGMQVVNSVTTLNRLREVWPESWQFAKQYEDTAARPALPVPIISAVNDLFKLPPAGRPDTRAVL